MVISSLFLTTTDDLKVHTYLIMHHDSRHRLGGRDLIGDSSGVSYPAVR